MWRTAFTSWALVCGAVGVAWGNPSDKVPLDALDVHSSGAVPGIAAAAQKISERNAAALDKFDRLAKANNFDKVNLLEVGQTRSGVVQLRRLAEQLIQSGEPAGFDFQLRAMAQGIVIEKVIETAKVSPALAPGIAASQQRLQVAWQNHQKQFPRLQKLQQRQDWEDLERALDETFDELNVMLTFATVETYNQIYLPYNEMRTIATEAMTKQRKAAAFKLLTERFDAAKPDYAKLITAINKAAAELKKSNKADLDDEDRTGPEAITYIDAQWRKLHVATLKTMGIELARASLAEPSQPQPNQIEALRAAYQQFTTDIEAAIMALVAADVERARGSEVPVLYQAYLPVLADLVDRADGKLADKLQAALEPLGPKDPLLAANIKAYRTTTDDLLRWRERVAADMARAKIKTALPLERAAVGPFQESSGTLGLWVGTRATTGRAELRDHAGRILALGAPQIVGKEVTVNDVAALGGTNPNGIARYRERLYSVVPLPADATKDAIAALEAELFVGEKTPPLTLTATRALRGAKRGDVVQAGGTLAGVFFEGHITRFATLSEAAAPLVPLGTLPDDFSTDQPPLAQVIIRANLTPTWLRQRYFLVDVKTP